MRLNINLARASNADADRARWLKSVTIVLTAAAIFISLFNVASYGLSRIQVDRYEEVLAAAGGGVSKEIEKIDKKELRRLDQEVALVNSIIAMESFSWTSLLTSLEGVVPGSVALVQISPNFKSGSIRMSAVGESVSGALKFVDALNESKEFTDAFLLSHSEKNIAKRPGSREKVLFEIIVRYSESGDI